MLILHRFAEQGDLLEFLIEYGEVCENQSRIWIKQIAMALDYLHDLEIVHRDLKCENILITLNYNLKIADFGFARYMCNYYIRNLCTTHEMIRFLILI